MLKRFLRTAKPLLPVAVVLLALSALVAQAVALEREMEALREDIGGVLDPARMNVRELQYFLSRETAGTRGFLLTGDTSYARRHLDARRRRQEVTEQLRTLAARAPDSMRLAVNALVAKLRPADLALDSLYSGRLSRDARARQSSEQARAEADERRAETERIAASRARLVRGFTHDVKNPLGAAAGCLQLIDEGLMDTRDGVRRARRSVESALRLTDDLLQLARVEADGMIVRREPVSICAVAGEVVEEWSGIAQTKGLALTTALPPDELVILSDAAKLRQIVGNLVSNAVRYTATGSVMLTVSTERRHTPDGAESVCIEVSDTGPGMSPEQCALLFEEFRRLDSARGTKGCGLGLAISSRLAAALGGRITVESELGEGSRFCLCLPREPVPPALETGVSEALSVAHPAQDHRSVRE